MTNYYFDTETKDSGVYADTDYCGNTVKFNICEFKNPLPQIYPYNLEEVQITLIKAVLVHEDIHVAIGGAVDTDGEQEHNTVYEWIHEWLVQT